MRLRVAVRKKGLTLEREPPRTEGMGRQRLTVIHAERHQGHTIVLVQDRSRPDRYHALVDPPLVREVARIKEPEQEPERPRLQRDPKVVREQEPAERLPQRGETIHLHHGRVVLEHDIARKYERTLKQEVHRRSGPDYSY